MSVAVDREQELLAGVRTIARDVAAAHADDVDRDGRFPAETIDALRAAGALSAPVPEALGGGGISLGTIAACCLRARALPAGPARWSSPCTRSSC